MKIVLLPGLDGTGELFSSFVQALSDKHDVKSIMYPFKEGLGYDVLTEYVLDVLPTDEPFVLLGESFSGPIAVAVAASSLPNLKGLVLVNTFLENPRPLLLTLLGFSSDKMLTNPPKKLLRWLLKNAEAEAVSVEDLISTVSSLSPSLIRPRLASVANVDAHTAAAAVKLPVCILRSTFDLAVSSRIAKKLVRAFPQSSVQLFDTNHFLLQAMPSSSAKFVDQFVHSRCSQA